MHLRDSSYPWGTPWIAACSHLQGSKGYLQRLDVSRLLCSWLLQSTEGYIVHRQTLFLTSLYPYPDILVAGKDRKGPRPQQRANTDQPPTSFSQGDTWYRGPESSTSGGIPWTHLLLCRHEEAGRALELELFLFVPFVSFPEWHKASPWLRRPEDSAPWTKTRVLYSSSWVQRTFTKAYSSQEKQRPCLVGHKTTPLLRRMRVLNGYFQGSSILGSKYLWWKLVIPEDCCHTQ